MKQTTLLIGGEERKLDFTRSGLMDHIQDASGKDAFEFYKQLAPEEGKDEIFVTKEAIAVLIYAGLNSALDVEGKDNIDFPKVKQWMRAVEQDRLSEVYTKVLSALTIEEKGGAPSQPEQGSN